VNTGADQAITIETFESDGTPLSTDNVTQTTVTPTGAHVPFSSSGNGTSFTFALITLVSANPIWLDDLGYVNDPLAQPAWSLSPGQSSTTVYVGGSVDVPLNLQRANGSKGLLTPSVTGLPAEVSASFSPADFSVVTSGAFTMRLNTLPDSYPTAFDVSVAMDNHGAATAGSGSTVSLHVVVVASVEATVMPVSTPEPCSTQNLRVSANAGYSGPADVSVAVWDLSLPGNPAVPRAVSLNGNLGSTTVTFTPSKRDVDVPITLLIPVAYQSDSLMWNVTVTVNSQQQDHRQRGLHPVPPAVIAVPVTVGEPVLTKENFTVRAKGLCPGASAEFGNSSAAVLMTGGTPSYNGYTEYRLAVPKYATSGHLTVRTQSGEFGTTLDAGKLTVTDARGTMGFPFRNYSPFIFTYDGAFTSAFGKDQTYDTIDLCYPFGCTVEFRDPVAMVYAAWVRTYLGNGHCFGISLTELQLRNHDLAVAKFVHTGPNGHDVTGPPQDSSGPLDDMPLFETIEANHLRQFSLEEAAWFASNAALNFGNSESSFINGMRSLLAKGPVILSMQGDSGGHAVVAYAVEDVGPNDYRVLVVDSNKPFTSGEYTKSYVHRTNVDRSSVRISPSGWNFPDPGTEFGSDYRASGSWGNWANPIVPIPYSVANGSATIPTLSSPKFPSTLVSFGSVGGGSLPVSVVGTPGHVIPLDSAGSRLTLAMPPGAASISVRGSRTGTYTETTTDGSTFTSVTAPSRAGAKDTITSGQGALSLQSGSSGTATISVVGPSGTGSAVSAKAVVPVRTGGTAGVQIKGGVTLVSTTSGGVVSLSETVSRSRGLPVTVSLRTTLPPKSRLEVASSLLSSGASSVPATLVTASGKRRVVVSLTRSSVARLGSVTAIVATHSGLSTITGRVKVARVNARTTGVLIVRVTSGKRIVARKVVRVPVLRRGTAAAVLRARLPRGTYRISVGLSASPVLGVEGETATAKVFTVTIR